jgi:hypothetical protein
MVFLDHSPTYDCGIQIETFKKTAQLCHFDRREKSQALEEIHPFSRDLDFSSLPLLEMTDAGVITVMQRFQIEFHLLGIKI